MIEGNPYQARRGSGGAAMKAQGYRVLLYVLKIDGTVIR